MLIWFAQQGLLHQVTNLAHAGSSGTPPGYSWQNGVGVAVWSKSTQAWLYSCQHADLKWITCPSAPCWDQQCLSALSRVTAGHLLPCKTHQGSTQQSSPSRKHTCRWFMKPPEVVCFCQLLLRKSTSQTVTSPGWLCMSWASALAIKCCKYTIPKRIKVFGLISL